MLPREGNRANTIYLITTTFYFQTKGLLPIPVMPFVCDSIAAPNKKTFRSITLRKVFISIPYGLLDD